MVGNKYRVHEVAKDFGIPTKQVTEILTKYAQTPKNHMQVLEDRELSLIFEYLTQHNQVSGIQVIFAEGIKADEEKKAAEQATKAAEPAKKAASQGTAPAKTAESAKKEAQPAKQPASRVPQTKVVDTRKATNVNLEKYDERLQDMAEGRNARPNGSNKRRDQQVQGKEKFRNNKQRQQGNFGANKRRQEEADRMRRLQLEIIKKTPVTVQIPDEISVGELASRMKKTGAEVVKCLMKNGVMASLSQLIDFDTAAIIAEEMGCKVEKEVVVTIEEKLIDDHKDDEKDLVPRAPVVVVMGHVDHGKTSLLDYIRHAHVASGEAGGITQHIGAYQVQVNGKPITFLDTPGHEAFTSMRARGAMVTDIAILVVAAEDGIMPQTIESINHAKAAEIPIIVAINKMDKPEANPERIKQQLTEYGLVCEEWGGDTIVCPISAKTGMGVDNLLEMLTLTAEVSELKANPNRAAQGTVIEARLDKGRGPVATLLVQNGTLKQGDIIIAGTSVGRVRAMINDKGQKITSAGPSVPVEITGLSEAPSAGATFNAVADEKLARELVEQRKEEAKAKANAPITKVSLEDLFSQIQAGEMKNLNLIVKADVQGSVEAVKSSLEKLSNDEVRVRVIHGGVGAINESDVMLAATSQAIIVGFNVRPDNAARDSAARANVDMRMYRVIYDAINEIESAMKGMLAPKFREALLGHAEVRQTYKVSGVGTVAGCYVQDGKIQRKDCQVRLVRDGIVVHEGTLASLQRFKDSVKEVVAGYECGLSIEKFNDIKEGDIVEAFTMEEIPQ
ncbi:MAG: translation initiation factor IF-2 [Oscillospiraceae bacterium]|nr:translation initiation factor IF-2 [Oscillospiraceae bacterium]